jgi:hypothetical protein
MLMATRRGSLLSLALETPPGRNHEKQYETIRHDNVLARPQATHAGTAHGPLSGRRTVDFTGYAMGPVTLTS